jgi:hypothetical protein
LRCWPNGALRLVSNSANISPAKPVQINSRPAAMLFQIFEGKIACVIFGCAAMR